MASGIIPEADCFSIKWSINNFSYCWQKTGEALVSPTFFINESKETKWKLLLFPRGHENDKYITLRLSRENGCVNVTDVDYRVQLLAYDGCMQEVRKDATNQYSILRAVIPGAKYLPQDILTFRCSILSREKTSEIQHIFVRTIIKVENMSFLSSIEKFSSLQPDQPQSFLVKSASKGIIMRIDLFVTNKYDTGIFMNINTFDQCLKYFTLKSFILDSEKNKVSSGESKCWLDSGKCPSLTLSFTKCYLMQFKHIYLPNDALTLIFELTISSGLAFNGIEKAYCEYTSHPTSNIVTEIWRNCTVHENISDCPCSLINDLTSLQKDQSTCDVKLQAKTNIFPVHTLILSARSPVFKAMFSSEMKETVNGCVDVSDIDDETVRRFILYLYTNQLEDLKLEDVFRLYTTADKYAVISLRDKCSSFFKNNFQLKTVCNVLALSALHQDSDLKLTAQNYILKNATEILRSEEWKFLVDTYPKLAVETMSRN